MSYFLVENGKIIAWYSDTISEENLTEKQYLHEVNSDLDPSYWLGKDVNELTTNTQNFPMPTPSAKELKEALRMQLKELYLEQLFANSIGEQDMNRQTEYQDLLAQYNNTEWG